MLTSIARSQARCILAMATLALAVLSCTTGLGLPATTTPVATTTNTPPPTPTATASEVELPAEITSLFPDGKGYELKDNEIIVDNEVAFRLNEADEWQLVKLVYVVEPETEVSIDDLNCFPPHVINPIEGCVQAYATDKHEFSFTFKFTGRFGLTPFLDANSAEIGRQWYGEVVSFKTVKNAEGQPVKTAFKTNVLLQVEFSEKPGVNYLGFFTWAMDNYSGMEESYDRLLTLRELGQVYPRNRTLTLWFFRWLELPGDGWIFYKRAFSVPGYSQFIKEFFNEGGFDTLDNVLYLSSVPVQ